MAIRICQNKACTTDGGRRATLDAPFEFGRRNEFCSEECFAAATGMPTSREWEMRTALHEALMALRLQGDPNPISAGAWVDHVVDFVCSRAARQAGRSPNRAPAAAAACSSSRPSSQAASHTTGQLRLSSQSGSIPA